ncbi:MAG: GNAT family N-acetyltransferase, partial [Parvibaculum sp.]
EDKLHCTELSLDGKPLAMLTSFRAGRGLYTFKIAFDEEYARYSPGVLLMLKLIGVVQSDERTDWADSCAVPNHPMIDHIWVERRTMRSVLVAGNGPLGRTATRYLTFAIKSEAALRAKFRTYYHAFRKEMENDKAD